MNKLEKQVLRLIGDDPSNPDVFSDTDQGLKPIRRSINDAIQELIIVKGGFIRTFSVPLVKDISFYRITLSDGFLGWVKNCWLVNQKRRLSQTDMLALRSWDHRWLTMTGTPETYFPVGVDVIGFHPKPSATSDMVEVSAVAIPAPYTNDKQKLRIKNTYQWAVVNYAVSEYWASRGDPQTAAQHFSVYSEMLGLKSSFTPSPEKVSTLATEKLPATEQQQVSV